MKKTLSFIMVMALLLASMTTAYAASPNDVAGTPYETAVNKLMEKGVVTGYPDGSYKPGDTINRAEACIIVVKSMGATEANLVAAASSGFPDLAGFEWASNYINYATAKGVISGYPDGTFRPNNNVTYNEMATMLVRALGFKATDLSGTWPSNFVSKAQSLGVFEGVSYQGNAAAIRGHVAVMDYNLVTEIEEANKTTTDENPAADNNPLAEFSGRAFGIVLDKASVLNEDGDVVEQVEFLFGDHILYLNTNGKLPAIDAPSSAALQAGVLYGLKLWDGVVTGIASGDQTASFAAIGTLTTFESHTTGWTRVLDRNDDVLKVEGGDIDPYYAIIDTASVYVALEVDGEITYTAGDLNDIDENEYVRLYTITGDNPGIVEIVLVSEYVDR